jgi:aspartate kinase
MNGQSGIKIFKFGGASVKEASAVENVANILKRFSGEKLVVVISAMDKTTNALEEIHKSRFHKQDYKPIFKQVKEYHRNICLELFGNEVDGSAQMESLFDELEEILLSPVSSNFDTQYDQIVSYGELVSTAIVNAYLSKVHLPSTWLDARQLIRTEGRHRDSRVNWSRCEMERDYIVGALEKRDIVITQGFIGSDFKGVTTTLGREGSDFTAAILAYLLDAESVTIWKDVPGMLNADPKWFKDTVKLDKISFREAIELAYYGASVIHPKTIKPLQNKGIPLYIKSFMDPDAAGSVIQESVEYDNLIPSYIFKKDQVLVSISTRDFSFVVEDDLRDIFQLLSQLGVRVNLMENSAISFSICIDKDEYKQEKLFELLRTRYQVRYNENLTLMTIRHYDDKTVNMLTKDRELMMEQRSRQTIRMVVR